MGGIGGIWLTWLLGVNVYTVVCVAGRCCLLLVGVVMFVLTGVSLVVGC